ncbi:ribonuclease H-like domain-containing protein [Tanacetum coccineum]
MKRSLSTNRKAARNEPKMFQRSTSLVKPSPVTVNHDASAGSNNVIKEIASKLAERRKSKVKALVNTFETVISASKLTERRKSRVKALVKAFETVISASKLAQSWKSKVKALVDAFETKKCAVEILERANMLSCNPSRTPVDTESKLGNAGDEVSDSTLYRSLAGSLQYLTFTRPDISYVVQQVCLHMHDPWEPHLSVLKRILRYIHGTLEHGLQLFSSTTSDLVAYSDADWASYPTTRRSTSGYYVFLGNNLLS